MRSTLLVPLTLLALACSDSATAPKTGQLFISIDGLPASVQPSVIVTGPGSFRQTVESSRTLPSLPEGSYTVTASPVTAGTSRYAALTASQNVTVRGTGPAAVTAVEYRLSSARLVVNVTGLPAGTSASIVATGPSGYSRALTATTQIDLLEPGSYTLVVSDVVVGGRTYRAVPNTRVLELNASLVSAVTSVDYGSGTGVLVVTIAGLLGDPAAAVTVTGPDGVSRLVTSTSTLSNLEAGRYTISAAVVGNAFATYTPTPASQTVDVATSGSAAATVTYTSAALQLKLQPFIAGLTQPVFLTAPDGDTRQFIVERPGRIRVVIGGQLQATPYLDIRFRVNNNGERGMLSMAFDPEYAANGFFYVYYVDLAGNVVVERFASAPGADIAGASAGVVISIPHGGSEHHGGLIAFGPDGMLYLGVGDGGCCGDPQNNAQNLATLLGKMLRIDVRTLPYAIPAGNPFVGQVGMRPEIWAYGFRNPWRYAFDPPAEMLYIADVGNDAREEVNASLATQAGLNYGWRYMEGLACFLPSSNCATGRSLTLPVFDYTHSEGCSVTGGYVYRGAAIPEIAGYYFFSDYCRGWLRSFRAAGAGVTDQRTWAGITISGAVSFGRDGAGELYVVAGTAISKIVRQ